MDKRLWHRRQLWQYLGLGIAGAGVTTAIATFSKQRQWGRANLSDPLAANSATHSTVPATSMETVTLAPPGNRLPEFHGISQWLNSNPLAIAQLKGQVVLVQFWTFACINCQRTLPYIVRWHQQYAKQGLQVIGVHTPEFAYERDVNNIKRALQQHQITYAVPVDNDYKTWNAYSNQYWPHLFLADRQGFIRYDHIGEGAYDITEQAIRQLLG